IVMHGLERRLGLASLGAVLIEGPISTEAIEQSLDLIALAGPILARTASLDDARDTAERLGQQSQRLTLMVDSLPDPVVITNADNDIVAQNDRAERLLQVREHDSAGRRRAIELNNLLFTSFLSKSAMTGGMQAGPRELNLV